MTDGASRSQLTSEHSPESAGATDHRRELGSREAHRDGIHGRKGRRRTERRGTEDQRQGSDNRRTLKKRPC